MKILDCTLRDGGYYNNWDFPSEVVNAYLTSIAESKIDYVELGLRNFPKTGFLGAFAYTSEAFLNSLDLPEGPTYGVMVDAKTILESSLSAEEAVDALFVPASKSKIGFVRVAAHFKEVDHSGPIVKQLKKLGYIVGYNLMQAAGKSSEIIAEKASQAKEWQGLDVLYFADSLGNMNAFEVERIVIALRTEWDGLLGIHTHDNMGKGLDNSLVANKAGVTWLDATITGMGRGAGNTPTESLLAMLDKKEAKYNSKPIYELVIRHFESMKKHYGWGSSLLYFLGAQNDVHPTYIQNLLSNSHYGTDEIVGAIDFLSQLEGTTSYNGAILNTALSFAGSGNEVSGTTEVVSLFNDRNVLVLTNGPSTKKYKEAIELYIKVVKPVVVSVNIVNDINKDLIDYYIISKNSKFLSDVDKYHKLSKPLILPMHRFTRDELSALEGLRLIDYGLGVSKDTFKIEDRFVYIPHDITTGYLLGVLNTANAKQIKTVGLDGYDKFDIRQQEMIKLLNLYHKTENLAPIESLTPTSYPIIKGSVYAIPV
jgi:4-hydroxy 2-oxovalerate aldolase